MVILVVVRMVVVGVVRWILRSAPAVPRRGCREAARPERSGGSSRNVELRTSLGNQILIEFYRCNKAQDFSWPIIELFFDDPALLQGQTYQALSLL